jgi:hypothetical protein
MVLGFDKAFRDDSEFVKQQLLDAEFSFRKLLFGPPPENKKTVSMSSGRLKAPSEYLGSHSTTKNQSRTTQSRNSRSTVDPKETHQSRNSRSTVDPKETYEIKPSTAHRSARGSGQSTPPQNDSTEIANNSTDQRYFNQADPKNLPNERNQQNNIQENAWTTEPASYPVLRNSGPTSNLSVQSGQRVTLQNVLPPPKALLLRPRTHGIILQRLLKKRHQCKGCR